MISMVRIDLNITKEQLGFLVRMGGTMSEHIRRAIDDYIVKIKGQNASTSPSQKGGK